MTKHILLINSPYPFEEIPAPPLGLMSIGAYLYEKGHDVRIEDYVVNKYTLDKAKNILKSFKPEIVGINAVTMNVNKSISILEDFKTLNPEIVTIMGGPHATFDAGNILKDHEHINIIVRREGEISLEELLNVIDDRDSYQAISGISFRRGKKVIHNPDRPFIKDINILPHPGYDLVQLGKYKALGTSINMISSRGCPYKCIFCVGSKMVGHKVRYYNIDRVVDEFESLSKLGFKQINIADDLFTSNKKRCMQICNEIINRGIKHEWTAFARVDTITEELLVQLKKAGCTTLCFGIESGDQEILDKIKKNTNLNIIKRAVKLCNKTGIIPMASYILGLPGESLSTAKKTMNFARELGANHGYHILAPFPGTEVRENCTDYGINILTDDWDRYDANQSVCESVFLPHKEVDEMVIKFNRDIDNSIKNIFTKFNNKEELSDFENNIMKNIKSFNFVQELIHKDLFERFKVKDGDSNEIVNNEIAKYLSMNTDFDMDEVSAEFHRLLDLDCVQINQINGNVYIEWV